MDPEKLPLLGDKQGARRRHRALSAEEVQNYQDDVTWRRSRFCLFVMLWGLLATCLSIVACLLVTAQCTEMEPPAVPPVHMSFAPLMSTIRLMQRKHV